MKSGYSCVINTVIYAVIINLVLPMVVKPFAIPEEIKPPNGADKLSFKSQLMHMLVHHAQVPLTSSLIIVLIVFLSMVLGYRFKIIK